MRSKLDLILVNSRTWIGFLGTAFLLTQIAPPSLGQEQLSGPEPVDLAPENLPSDDAARDVNQTLATDRSQDENNPSPDPALGDSALESSSPFDASQTVNPEGKTLELGSTSDGTPLDSAAETEIDPAFAADVTQTTEAPDDRSLDSTEAPNSPELNPALAPSDSRTLSEVASPVQILSPTPNEAMARPAVAVVIQAPMDSVVTLEANGQPVDNTQVGQVTTDGAQGIIRQIWYGVALQEGQNLLRATATLPDGTVYTTEQPVMLRGAIASMHLETLEAQVPADGRSKVRVRGYFLDPQGNLSNRGARVTLSATDGTFRGADLAPQVDGFQVDADTGEFIAELQSSSQTGIVTIRAEMLDLTAETQVQFGTPPLPDGLVAGVIDVRLGPSGTDYFDRFGDFLPPDDNGDYGLDVNGALFLRGSFGDWLLTGAYNSDHAINETCSGCTQRLNRADQASEKPYPIYGDESKITNLTPSQDQVYLRLERTPNIPYADPDYVMWGDYASGREFATPSQELTALSRQLHGAKLNYNLGDLQVSGLYSQGGQAFQRDTILPDGTRGIYFLSKRLVVPGSEEVYEEFEALERPGTVVRRERLDRITDYEIDYDRGSLFFEDPQRRTEIDDRGDVLVRRLIVSYQHDTSGSDTSLYSGRLRYHVDRQPGHATALGATYTYEDKGSRSFSLYGVDVDLALGEGNRLVAEYAHSDNDTELLRGVGGHAYRVDLSGKLWDDRLQGRVYYDHTDTGFANQSTVSFVPGLTRYGLDTNTRLAPNTTLRFGYDHEDNRGFAPQPVLELGDLLALTDQPEEGTRLDHSLTTIKAGIQQRFGAINLTSDWIYRDRNDRLNPDRGSRSSQLRTQLATPLTSTLRLRFLNQTTLSADTDSAYSDRTQLGLDWRVFPGINLGVNQDWYTRGRLAGQTRTNVTLGADHQWHLAKHTSISARYGIDGDLQNRGLGDNLSLGLDHQWTIIPGLDLDFNYERIFDDFLLGGLFGVGQGASRSTRNQSGNSVSVGVRYTDNPNWKGSGRLEYRDTGGYGATNLSFDVSGRVTSSLSTLLSYDRAFASGRGSRNLGASTTLRLGLAYRHPEKDEFNALLRYEYRQNPSTTPETLLIGRGTGSSEHVLATEMIYAPHWRWELYGKVGLRFASSYLADNYTAHSTIALTQLRSTYHINRRWDVVGEARWIGQPTANYSEFGLLGEFGYHLTPTIRLAAGYSSGSINSDRDFSGSRSNGGFYGGLTLKLDRLFEGFGVQNPLPSPVRETRLIRAAVDDEETLLQASLPQDLVRLNLSQVVQFQPGTTNLTPESMVVLDSLATVLTEYGDMQVDLQAPLGAIAQMDLTSPEVQQIQIARAYLLSQGVKGSQLVIRSLGAQAQAERPIGIILSANPGTFANFSARLADPSQNLLDRVLPLLDGATTAQAPTPDSGAQEQNQDQAHVPPTVETIEPVTPLSSEAEDSLALEPSVPKTPPVAEITDPFAISTTPDRPGAENLGTIAQDPPHLDLPAAPQAQLPSFLQPLGLDPVANPPVALLPSRFFRSADAEASLLTANASVPQLGQVLALALNPIQRPSEPLPLLSLVPGSGLLKGVPLALVPLNLVTPSQNPPDGSDDLGQMDQPLATSQPVPVNPLALVFPEDDRPTLNRPSTISMGTLDQPSPMILADVLDLTPGFTLAGIFQPTETFVSLPLSDRPTLLLGLNLPTQPTPLAAAAPIADRLTQPLASRQPIPLSPQALALPNLVGDTWRPSTLTLPATLSFLIEDFGSASVRPNLLPSIAGTLLTQALPATPSPAQDPWISTLLPPNLFTPLALANGAFDSAQGSDILAIPLALLPTSTPSLQASLPRIERTTANDRRLMAALRFLLQSDTTALETVLQASGIDPYQGSVTGQVVDFDAITINLNN